MLSTSRRGRKDDQMFDSQTLEAEINETSSAQCEHAGRRSRSRSPEPKNTSLTKSRDTAENNNNIYFLHGMSRERSVERRFRNYEQN